MPITAGYTACCVNWVLWILPKHKIRRARNELESVNLVYLQFLRHVQYLFISYTVTGSEKGKGNHYIQLDKLLYCKTEMLCFYVALMASTQRCVLLISSNFTG